MMKLSPRQSEQTIVKLDMLGQVTQKDMDAVATCTCWYTVMYNVYHTGSGNTSSGLEKYLRDTGQS